MGHEAVSIGDALGVAEAVSDAVGVAEGVGIAESLLLQPASSTPIPRLRTTIRFHIVLRVSAQLAPGPETANSLATQKP